MTLSKKEVEAALTCPDSQSHDARQPLDGVFVLNTTLTNPKPDRRGKAWAQLPVWECGTRFIVRVVGDGRMRAVHRSGQISYRDVEHINASTLKDQFKEFVAHLDPVKDATFAEFCSVQGISGSDLEDVVERLVTTGQMSRGDVLRLYNEVQAEYEARLPKET